MDILLAQQIRAKNSRRIGECKTSVTLDPNLMELAYAGKGSESAYCL